MGDHQGRGSSVLRKKVCLVGGFAVGKTSLVARYVRSIFSERYQTTVGVKIDERVVELAELQVKLVIWDLQGEDEFQSIRPSYLRGAAGVLYVADGTRPETLETAVRLRDVVRDAIGDVPAVLLVNKSDLDWSLEADDLDSLTRSGWTVLSTSAKTGAGVEQAFEHMAEVLAS